MTLSERVLRAGRWITRFAGSAKELSNLSFENQWRVQRVGTVVRMKIDWIVFGPGDLAYLNLHRKIPGARAVFGQPDHHQGKRL
jgi:hypothetical protein